MATFIICFYFIPGFINLAILFSRETLNEDTPSSIVKSFIPFYNIVVLAKSLYKIGTDYRNLKKDI